MTQNPKLLFATTEALAPTIIPKAVGHPPNPNADAQLLSLLAYLLSLALFSLVGEEEAALGGDAVKVFLG